MCSSIPTEAFMRIPSLDQAVASPSGQHVVLTIENQRPQLLNTSTRELSPLDSADQDSTFFWDSSGTSIFFESQGDETTDIYEVYIAESVVIDHLVTLDRESMLWDVSPDGRYLYYRSGEELRRYNVDTSQSQLLLSGYQFHRFSVGGCSPDGDRIAFTTDPSVNSELTAYIAAADGTEVTKIDVDTPTGDIVTKSWHPDGERLLVSTHPTHGTTGLYDLDSEQIEWFPADREHQLRHLPGPDMPIDFVPDGSGFLLRRNITELNELVYQSLDGSAYTLNIDGRVLIDPERTKICFGDQVITRRETATRPGDIVQYDLTDDRTEIIFEIQPERMDLDSFVTPKLIKYETADGGTAPGYLYDSGQRPSPAIVDLYGYRSGLNKRFDRHIQWLVYLGYSVFQPIHPGEPFTDAEHANHAAAAEWLTSLPWIDGERIVALGHSHGGYDVCMQAVSYPEPWTAGVAISGYPDLPAFADSWDDLEFIEVFLGDPTDCAREWQHQSPMHRINDLNGAPTFPLLLVHPEDDFIPKSQFQTFQDALVEAGTPASDVTTIELEGIGHNPRSTEEHVYQWETVEDFITDQV